jgi:arylsulfatase A-like enzyme
MVPIRLSRRARKVPGAWAGGFLGAPLPQPGGFDRRQSVRGWVAVRPSSRLVLVIVAGAWMVAAGAAPVRAGEVPVAGSAVRLRASRATAKPTRLSVVLNDRAIAAPLPDPRTGVTIRIDGGPGAGQCESRIRLDTAGWRERRRGGALRGYRYRAPRPGTRGIRRVDLRPGRIVVRGRGADLPCVLAAGSERVPLAVDVRVGAQRYCAAFGGRVKANRAGRFIARRAAAPTTCGPERPNVVVLMADDLGYRDLGVQGSRAIATPHIDALAAEGTRLTSAYATAATCSPSRAAFLTGRYQQRDGFEFNTGGRQITQREERGLDPAATTIADALRAAGYATGMIGKWHLGTRDRFHPLVRGFDEFFGFLPGEHPYFPDGLEAREVWETIQRGGERVTEPEYLTTAFAREAVDFIGRHRDEPFFLYVAFNAVHLPLQAPESYRARYADVADDDLRTYYAMTSALDDAVGTILAALDVHGLADDTLVVLTNDNGGVRRLADNAPLRLGKTFLFEGGVRVPTIVRWPRVTTAGTVHAEPVSLLDFAPTFLGAAGAPAPDGPALDGVDLRPHLAGEVSGSTHDFLFWRNGPNRAARHGRWKLVQAGDHVWLFDLDADIGEHTNLAAAHPRVVTELQGALAGWEAELRPPAWPSRQERTVIVDGAPYEIHI